MHLFKVKRVSQTDVLWYEVRAVCSSTLKYRVIRNDCRGFNNQQFGTNSVIVLMFVESQRVHI